MQSVIYQMFFLVFPVQCVLNAVYPYTGQGQPNQPLTACPVSSASLNPIKCFRFLSCLICMFYMQEICPSLHLSSSHNYPKNVFFFLGLLSTSFRISSNVLPPVWSES